MEKAYKRMSFNEALNMLNLKKSEDLIHLASQVFTKKNFFNQSPVWKKSRFFTTE